MTPEAAAERVAEIARVYAYRRKHNIAHTGHTVRRLLLAVGALLGKPVTFAEGSTSPVPAPKREPE
jgi:hypothetical protein